MELEAWSSLSASSLTRSRQGRLQVAGSDGWWGGCVISHAFKNNFERKLSEGDCCAAWPAADCCRAGGNEGSHSAQYLSSLKSSEGASDAVTSPVRTLNMIKEGIEMWFSVCAEQHLFSLGLLLRGIFMEDLIQLWMGGSEGGHSSLHNEISATWRQLHGCS